MHSVTRKMTFMNDLRFAPDGPGIEPRWTRGTKLAVGTAYSTSSRVWYTLDHGCVTEVYYPTIDTPQVRDLLVGHTYSCMRQELQGCSAGSRITHRFCRAPQNGQSALSRMGLTESDAASRSREGSPINNPGMLATKYARTSGVAEFAVCHRYSTPLRIEISPIAA